MALPHGVAWNEPHWKHRLSKADIISLNNLKLVPGRSSKTHFVGSAEYAPDSVASRKARAVSSLPCASARATIRRACDSQSGRRSRSWTR